MRLRREAAMFKATAIESLTLSIELFNRPSPLARDHAVVMMLAHAFEMLLKSSIFQRRGRVRDPGDDLSHSLLRCIEISYSDLQTVSSDERMLLMAIKQDRDCATHDTIVMSDDLLWLHMRAGITLFDRILRDGFGERLTDVLPSRVIPVSAAPPTELPNLVEVELDAVRDLLAKGRRRTAEASARLRPLLSLDGSATGRSDQPTAREVARAEASLRAGKDWKSIFPGLATLTIGTPDPNSGGQEVVLRVGQDPNALPVRRARPGDEDEALAYRGVSPFDEYSIKLSKFGEHLGLSRHEGHALIAALNLKSDDRAYFVRKNQSGNVVYQGLSARALELGKRALADTDFNLDDAVRAYNSRGQRQP